MVSIPILGRLVVLAFTLIDGVGAASLRAAGAGGGNQGPASDPLAAASSMAAAAPGQYGELGNGDIVNLGHNQHASGLGIHHPKVNCRKIYKSLRRFNPFLIFP